MKSIGLLSVEPLLKSNELVSALKKLALNPRKVSRYKAVTGHLADQVTH